MSYDLNSYFQLGLDSTAQEQNELVMNTIRTPVDTQSGRDGLSKVTFKVPKVGMMTGDSMIKFGVIKNTATTSNCTPNFVSGVAGSIERLRITIDNKVLTDIERPSLLNIPDEYSKNTQNENAQFKYKFTGQQFQSNTDQDNGAERFDTLKTRYFSDQDENNDVQNVVRNRVGDQADSHVYGIHLRDLGAQYLDTSALPVFLLGAREMIIELFFYKDCREYLVATSGTLGAGDYRIDYPLVELVTTHVRLPDEVMQNEISGMQNKPIEYPLIDNYLVKGTFSTGAQNVVASNTFRINAQNREVHRILMVNQPISTDIDGNQRVVANQKALALGDVELQVKANGLNYFERPIVNPSLLYQQLTYAQNGMALKLPYNAYNVDNRTDKIEQNDQTLYLNYRGTQQYVALDFENGNPSVFGGGTIMKQALEVEYKATPRTTANPDQVNKQHEVLFYVSVSKMLAIGARSIEVSF
jgi:hypothetical protein